MYHIFAPNRYADPVCLLPGLFVRGRVGWVPSSIVSLAADSCPFIIKYIAHKRSIGEPLRAADNDDGGLNAALDLLRIYSADFVYSAGSLDFKFHPMASKPDGAILSEVGESSRSLSLAMPPVSCAPFSPAAPPVPHSAS